MKPNPIRARFLVIAFVTSCLVCLGRANFVAAQSNKAFDVGRIEETGGMVIAVRPQEIVSLNGFKPFAAIMGDRMEQQYGFKLDQIQQFVFHGIDTNDPFGFRLAIKLNADLDGEKYLNGLTRSQEVETIEYRGDSYLKAPVPEWATRRRVTPQDLEDGEPKERPEEDEEAKELRSSFCLWQFDDESAVVAREDVIKKLVSKQKPTQELLKGKAWKQVDTQDVAATFDASILEALITDLGQMEAPGLAEIKELAENFESASVGVQVDETSKLVGYVYCQSPTHSRKAKDAIDKLVEVSKNLIKMQLAGAAKKGSPETSMMELTGGVLENLKITRTGNLVKLQSTVDTTKFLDSSADAAGNARQAAFRAMSMNNGKQLALAFHNYADTYKKFPAAVLTGPKGHKYSWRVEVLPYIDQKALYDQYNFEEDWDSANNLKVLEQMPAVFRNPNSDKDSTETSYLAFVGPDTLFWKDGATFSDVRDGTSNTIMYVESKKAVPWTKPEDIAYDPFDPEKLAPTLGGFYDDGFNAVFADGSVRFIESDIDEAKLHSMIQMSDEADATE